jgi:hypothetical protein
MRGILFVVLPIPAKGILNKMITTTTKLFFNVEFFLTCSSMLENCWKSKTSFFLWSPIQVSSINLHRSEGFSQWPSSTFFNGYLKGCHCFVRRQAWVGGPEICENWKTLNYTPLYYKNLSLFHQNLYKGNLFATFWIAN